MGRPGAIFVDAVGTLFGVRGGVGQIYSDCARRVGAIVPAEALQKAFRQCFAVAPPPAFPQVAPQDIPQAEFDYWYRITEQTFAQAGGLGQIGDFAAFFAQVYATFATAEPWERYPDVLPALGYWRGRGVPVGVISNFDSRLYKVLEVLGLQDFIKTVTISTQAGAAKPQGEIFQAAWLALGQPEPPLWHIGDSWSADVLGARAMGWRGIYLCRGGGEPRPDQVSTLTELMDWG